MQTTQPRYRNHLRIYARSLVDDAPVRRVLLQQGVKATIMGRVMAKRYKDDVGPWAQYLSVMR